MRQYPSFLNKALNFFSIVEIMVFNGIFLFNIVLVIRDLCINRETHFSYLAMPLLGQGLKKSPIGQNWILLIILIYAKVSTTKLQQSTHCAYFANK
ncbi:hypothetical protein BSPWISOXPB_4549 [uncultured Gammaproteobacteria bacterium]|nr:hypothetical protein BSPWISOXPB_4549 [uncultured Gammaproteobacteria bacterium]